MTYTLSIMLHPDNKDTTFYLNTVPSITWIIDHLIEKPDRASLCNSLKVLFPTPTRTRKGCFTYSEEYAYHFDTLKYPTALAELLVVLYAEGDITTCITERVNQKGQITEKYLNRYMQKDAEHLYRHLMKNSLFGIFPELQREAQRRKT